MLIRYNEKNPNPEILVGLLEADWLEKACIASLESCTVPCTEP